MTEPYTLQQEERMTHFVADRLVAVECGINLYDAMYKEGKDPWSVVQRYNNLNVRQDIIEYQDIYHSLGIKQSRLNCAVFRLIDPTWKAVDKTRKDLTTMLKEPDTSVFIVYLFACHGVQREGKQCAVVNEYDKRTGFYRLYPAEDDVRRLSKKYPNSYHLVFFACCREYYNGPKVGVIRGP